MENIFRMGKKMRKTTKEMKKVYAILSFFLFLTGCGSNNGSASLKDITSAVREIKDAPPYEAPAKNDEQWGPIVKKIEKESKWLNTELEGYVIPTVSDVDGIDVVWPCEVYSVEYRHPYFEVTFFCKIKLGKDFRHDEIGNKHSYDWRAFFHFVGFDDDGPCQYVSGVEIPIEEKDRRYDSATRTMTYLKGAEPMFLVRTRIYHQLADGFDKIKEIHIVSGNNAEAIEMMNNDRNKIRR